MEQDEKMFGVADYLQLLGEVMLHHGTGVVTMRFHVRDGIPWAASIHFDNAKEGSMTDHHAA
jgi:hypothetical protein